MKNLEFPAKTSLSPRAIFLKNRFLTKIDLSSKEAISASDIGMRDLGKDINALESKILVF